MDPVSHNQLKDEIATRIGEDRVLLDQLRREIRPLKHAVRRIQPRSTTSISLVGTDGGINRLEFDPFLVQLIRVVDSSNNEYCLEAITPTTSVSQLSTRQFDGAGKPATPLGELMADLGCTDLTQLSPMIRRNDGDRPTSPSWIQVYRELVEWAVLFSLIRTKQFGTDTLFLFDGLLRSKVFAHDLFRRYLAGLAEAIDHAYQSSRRRIYLAGMAKHSKVLSRYRLAMALEGILRTDYPAYVEIPREIEQTAYVWSEYARGDEQEIDGGEINKFVGGKMFSVKFGSSPHDPIWPIDIFSHQVAEAQTILGCMLADAINGFPVPFYPQSLQRAHENAALVDFDFDVLQGDILDSLRQLLGDQSSIVDIIRLHGTDPSQRRYG